MHGHATFILKQTLGANFREIWRFELSLQNLLFIVRGLRAETSKIIFDNLYSDPKLGRGICSQ